ncbi:MAG: hypothetical protein LBV75_00405 [Paludibacter sp.]|nr:hypothetical protein [Paludibacter sp.]
MTDRRRLKQRNARHLPVVPPPTNEIVLPASGLTCGFAGFCLNKEQG